MGITSPRPIGLVLLASLLIAPPALHAQPVGGADTWRAFVDRLPPGTIVKVRLRNGPRFTATLLGATPDAMTVQPRTRAAVPPQRVPFDRIETLEVEHGRGVGVGKAVAIGAAVAAGAWLALMAMAFAVWGE